MKLKILEKLDKKVSEMMLMKENNHRNSVIYDTEHLKQSI